MVYQNIGISPVIFGVAGKKNSGKTHLMVELIRILSGRGYKVAAIKHDGHEFEADREGTDSWRHYQAGACGTVVFSDEKFQLVKLQKNCRLEELISFFPEADVILVEGMKHAPHEKIMCGYPEVLPDVEKIVDRIEEKIQKERARMMEIERLMENIQLPEEGRNCVRTFQMPESFYESWKKLFYDDGKTFF